MPIPCLNSIFYVDNHKHKEVEFAKRFCEIDWNDTLQWDKDWDSLETTIALGFVIKVRMTMQESNLFPLLSIVEDLFVFQRSWEPSLCPEHKKLFEKPQSFK